MDRMRPPRILLPILLLIAILPLAAQVHFAADKIDIDVDGKPFTTLYFGADAYKPFLAPLRSASGKIVTRRYPMEKVEGESSDHLHHRGLWFSYDDVNGVKFWENDPSYKKGTIGRIVARRAAWKDGPKSGVLECSFDWNDANGSTLLVENRTMTFPSSPTLRIIDFDINLTAADKVTFGDTKEGAFAIRLADALAEKKGTGRMTSADGKQGMKEIWGTRSNWVDYSGTIEGEQVGVAIFDHPSNPRHPTYWHARDYALFALNPFGQKAFDPSQEESHWVLEAGQSIRFRWRVVIHPGDGASAHLADLYSDFAK
jgi:Methane oxygenase PmoA